MEIATRGGTLQDGETAPLSRFLSERGWAAAPAGDDSLAGMHKAQGPLQATLDISPLPPQHQRLLVLVTLRPEPQMAVEE